MAAQPEVIIQNSTQDGDSTILRLTEAPIDGKAGGYLHYDGSANSFHIGTHISGTDTKKITILRDSTKVGIGVTAPDEVLHIKHTEAVIKLEDSATTGAGYIDFDGGGLQLNTNRNPNTGAVENSAKSHAGIIVNGNGASSYINFYTAATANTTATSRMYISGSGEVGIATSSPNSPLDVRRSSDGIALELISTVGDADELFWCC